MMKLATLRTSTGTRSLRIDGDTAAETEASRNTSAKTRRNTT
jgi:hypothetical protein